MLFLKNLISHLVAIDSKIMPITIRTIPNSGNTKLSPMITNIVIPATNIMGPSMARIVRATMDDLLSYVTTGIQEAAAKAFDTNLKRVVHQEV